MLLISSLSLAFLWNTTKNDQNRISLMHLLKFRIAKLAVEEKSLRSWARVHYVSNSADIVWTLHGHHNLQIDI